MLHVIASLHQLIATIPILAPELAAAPYGSTGLTAAPSLLAANPATLTIAYAALLGLIVGSAINAVVWRLYVGRSWARGRSQCPECHHVLAARDLVPVISWLALRGRCRYCRARIHWQYPVVELLTAALFGLSAAALAPNLATTGGSAWPWIQLGLWLVALTLLIILAVYDTRWMILPDKIMLPLILTAAAMLVLRLVQYHQLAPVRGPILAALIAGSGFYAIAAVTRGRAMGGGDIKLAAAMGLLLGLQGTAVALLIAFDSAALVGLTLIITHRARRRDHIAFGPFLVAGTVIAYLYGHDLIHWYLRLNGLA